MEFNKIQDKNKTICGSAVLLRSNQCFAIPDFCEVTSVAFPAGRICSNSTDHLDCDCSGKNTQAWQAGSGFCRQGLSNAFDL